MTNPSTTEHPSWCLADLCTYPTEPHYGERLLLSGDSGSDVTGSARLSQAYGASAPRLRLSLARRGAEAVAVLLSLRQGRDLSRLLRDLAARGRRP